MKNDWTNILLDSMFIMKQGSTPRVHLDFAKKVLSEEDYTALVELVKENT